MSQARPAAGDTIQIEYDGESVTATELVGRLEPGSPRKGVFRKLARKLIKSGKRLFVADLGGVTHIDDIGIFHVVQLFASTTREDCITLLAGISDELHGSLEAQAFDPTANGGPFETVDSAIDSFKTTLGL